jgi:hypothetical protein
MIAAIAWAAGVASGQSVTVLMAWHKARKRRALGYADLSAHRSYQYPERRP